MRALRVARLAWHVLRAATVAATLFPFLSAAQRRLRVRWFSRELLAILGVRLTVSGEPPRAADTPAMLVANHVSWLDICAINAAHAMRFVAKSEIRRWPLIGWLCAQGGTLFIERAQRRHTLNINAQIVAGLKAGDTFAVFPEGTITSGDVVLPKIRSQSIRSGKVSQGNVLLITSPSQSSCVSLSSQTSVNGSVCSPENGFTTCRLAV